VPDIPSDGNIRVSWVTSIAVITAPTVAELNLGLLLASIATGDGLVAFQPDTADVPTRKLNSTFNSVDVGTISMSGTMLRFYKQSGVDTIHNTLVKNAVGFVVIRRSLPSATAWASSQLLQGVYPAKCGQRRWLDVEENTEERYEVPLKITAEPAFDAVVA
jgi:hypothetical protein